MTKTKTRKNARSHTTKKRTHVPLHHRVKRVFHATPKFVHGMITGAFVGVIIVGVLGSNGVANADSPAVSVRDCTANSVIYCGNESLSELINKYNNGDSDPYGNANKVYEIHDIYNWFSISPTDINNIGSTAVTGYVTKSGGVYTGDPNGSHSLVATDAISAGRQDIDGSASTREKYGTTSFWINKPSVAFLNPNLKAFVVMKNGVFQYAILLSCGNPVKATPVQPPKPPAPKPALACSQLNVTPGTIDESSGDQNYTLQAQATPSNGATIISYTFKYGDGTPNRTVDTNARSASVMHTYSPGTYKAVVT